MQAEFVNKNSLNTLVFNKYEPSSWDEAKTKVEGKNSGGRNVVRESMCWRRPNLWRIFEIALRMNDKKPFNRIMLIVGIFALVVVLVWRCQCENIEEWFAWCNYWRVLACERRAKKTHSSKTTKLNCVVCERANRIQTERLIERPSKATHTDVCMHIGMKRANESCALNSFECAQATQSILR